MNRPQDGFLYLGIWVACVFVSILLHEMGHVVMGNIFHSRGHIVLWSFGGLAIGSNLLHNRWQRVAVSFAGPGIQLVLAGVLFLVELGFLHGYLSRELLSRPLIVTLYFLLEINLGWAILNLLPIWPLDGGMITRELFEWRSPRDGVRGSLILSAVVAGGLALLTLMERVGNRSIDLPWWIRSFTTGGTYMIFFYAMFAIGSIQLLQQQPPSRRNYDDDDHLPWERQRPEPWERDSDYWKR